MRRVAAHLVRPLHDPASDDTRRPPKLATRYLMLPSPKIRSEERRIAAGRLRAFPTVVERHLPVTDHAGEVVRLRQIHGGHGCTVTEGHEGVETSRYLAAKPPLTWAMRCGALA